MPRATPILTNFTSGELSPLLDGRVDLSRYYNGVKKLENFLIMPHGGVTRTPGTYFVAEVKDSSKKTRLIPFQFSTEQAYILEFGDQYIRFYMNGGQILDGGSPYEISTPYQESELFELQFAQEADVMWIVHPNHKPRKLSRTGHTAWTLSEVEFINGPYLPDNTTSTTITPSATTGSITLTASSNIFQPQHVGALWRIKTGYVKITAYTSGTQVSADVKSELADTLDTTDWAEGADYRGWPNCVTLYEQRLFFANTKTDPQTVWGSKTGKYDDFTSGANDDDALEYTIGSEQVNAILWM